MYSALGVIYGTASQENATSEEERKWPHATHIAMGPFCAPSNVFGGQKEAKKLTNGYLYVSEGHHPLHAHRVQAPMDFHSEELDAKNSFYQGFQSVHSGCRLTNRYPQASWHLWVLYRSRVNHRQHNKTTLRGVSTPAFTCHS